MNRRARGWLLGILALLAVASTLAFEPVRSSVLKLANIVHFREAHATTSPVEPVKAPAGHVELDPDTPNGLSVPPDVAKAFQLQTAPAITPTRPRVLSLAGSLALDTNRLAHVHTRFIGEVISLGMVPDTNAGASDTAVPFRPLRYGDHVHKGQVMAVLWSSELGEKKSEYVDMLSKLRLERETLARLEQLYKDEAVAERSLREEKRNVESAEIAAARVERALRSWRLPESEIAELRAEAELVHDRQESKNGPVEDSWGRVELLAPLDGVVLEKNLAVGDIVDTSLDLFKLADLSQLRVWAYIYEEDLPTLLRLPQPIDWKVHLQSDPTAPVLGGKVDKIGDIIDPVQHTALVLGHVDNLDSRMRAGQFITASIDLPPTSGEVEVPISAVVDDGDDCVVFVQPDPTRPVYAMKDVRLLRRSGPSAFVHPAGDSTSGAGELVPGTTVVSSGALELRAALGQLQAASREKP